RPDLPAQPEYLTMEDRLRNREALDQELAAAIASRSTADWTALLDRAGLVVSPINTVNEIFDHPQVRANGFVEPVTDDLQLVTAPMKYESWPSAFDGPPPALGEHTQEVLQGI